MVIKNAQPKTKAKGFNTNSHNQPTANGNPEQSANTNQGGLLTPEDLEKLESALVTGQINSHTLYRLDELSELEIEQRAVDKVEQNCDQVSEALAIRRFVAVKTIGTRSRQKYLELSEKFQQLQQEAEEIVNSQFEEKFPDYLQKLTDFCFEDLTIKPKPLPEFKVKTVDELRAQIDQRVNQLLSGTQLQTLAEVRGLIPQLEPSLETDPAEIEDLTIDDLFNPDRPEHDPTVSFPGM